MSPVACLSPLFVCGSFTSIPRCAALMPQLDSSGKVGNVAGGKTAQIGEILLTAVKKTLRVFWVKGVAKARHMAGLATL